MAAIGTGAVGSRWRRAAQHRGYGFRELGFVDLGQCAEERLGVARTTAQDLAQAARFGARHPAMAAPCEAGEIPTRQAVLLARELGIGIDEPALEAWLSEVRDSTVKRLEKCRAALEKTRSRPPPELAQRLLGT